jgi:PmbA protein
LFDGAGDFPFATSGEEPAEASAAKMAELALELERLALSKDPRMAVDLCVIGDTRSKILISNSHGLDLSHASGFYYAALSARATEGGKAKTASKSWCGRDFGELSLEDLATETSSRALRQLSATSVPSGALPVAFSPAAARQLFSCFAPVFYADNAQKGLSLLKGKEGGKVASSVVSIKDDGICRLSCGNQPFDSEGVPCRSKTLVESGVLQTLLHNLKSGAKAGVPSTGNGFRISHGGAVETSASNLYMSPSSEPLEKTLKGTGKTLAAHSLMGLHSGANAVTGDFSLLVSEGFLLEGGASRPVEQVAIAGNFFELMKRIVAAGNDLEFGIPGRAGTVGMPSFLAEELRVSGEAR